MEERLQKFLSNQGVCSRRKAEEYILAGKVKVNGKIVTELGTKVNSEQDLIEFDGKKISNEINKVYILLNKPIGYVTTVKDQFSRQTVMDLVKVKEKVLPVGRLDMYTSGAILLSNDGDFIYEITHPKHEINKTYQVTVTKQAEVRIMKIDKEKDISRIEIIIHEGKNRQVRRMCEAVGRKVLALHRSKIGNLSVKDLKLGSWRYLKKEEVQSLLNTKLDK